MHQQSRESPIALATPNLVAAQVGADMVISVAGGATMTLVGVTLSSLAGD